MPETKTYFTAVGRRKTASARVKITPAPKSSVTVNGKDAKDYFKTDERASITGDVFKLADWKENYAVEAKVAGGGINAQAEAVRHGIARAVEKAETGSRPTLKLAGFLTRDQRSIERKKPGLRKARKSPQWSKR
jgi:small subunit ribosomal protein S9